MLAQLGITPEPGMVLMCDFDGYIRPEIVKRRHVIVVSPKLQNELGTTIVVPVSSKNPHQAARYHVFFPAGSYGFFYPDKPCWAKCNMIAHARIERLDRVKCDHGWDTPRLTDDDFAEVIRATHGALAQI